MKTRHFIGTAVIFIITVYFVAAGIAGSQGQVVTEDLVIEKAAPSLSIEQSLTSGDQFEQFEQDRSILSKTTLISLLVAVIGIVAFRRNTYS